MRVYEFAKQINMASKDLVKILVDAGYTDIKSHMSQLSEKEERFLADKFAPKKTEEKPAQQKVAPSTNSQSLHKASAGTALEKDKNQKRSEENVNKEIAPSIQNSTAIVDDMQLGQVDGLKQDSRPVGTKTASKKKTFTKAPRVRNYGPRVKKQPEELAPITEIIVTGDEPLFALAERMRKPAGALILELLKRGVACNRNDLVPQELIAELARLFEITPIFPPKVKEKAKEENLRRSTTGNKNLVPRCPVVVVMGHVDHGKTTLLDFVRKTSIAQREHGGITQQLGAYEVESKHGKIVFIDTPGHEAFASMRGRGVRITDLAILVVAADDGVKPQTVEAIEQAKAASIPIIVAITKIDKGITQEQIERVKRQLAEHKILVEDWGGDTVVIPISAKTGKGIEELLEMIVLQSQMLELTTDVNAPARAFVLESKMDRGFGPVATVIPIEGVIRKGDYFASGDVTGKIRLLITSSGAKVNELGASLPAQLVGFDVLPEPGATLNIIPEHEYSKIRSGRLYKTTLTPTTHEVAGEQAINAIQLIIKTDSQGSVDAIQHTFNLLSKKNKSIQDRLRIISCTIGDISEGDVQRAADCGARLLGLHTRIDRKAVQLMKQLNVKIDSYDVIYHMTEAIEDLLERTKKAIKISKKVGTLEVRKTFRLKDSGIIAGCYVTEGTIVRSGRVKCVRDGVVIGEDMITSLQRNKKAVKDVKEGFECAFMCKTFHDWQVGDEAECYIEEEIK